MLNPHAARIAIATLTVAAKRAVAVAGSRDTSAVKAAVVACHSDLVRAERELSFALNGHPYLRNDVVDNLLKLGDALAALEATAVRLGIGENAPVHALRNAEAALRGMIGLGLRLTERKG